MQYESKSTYSSSPKSSGSKFSAQGDSQSSGPSKVTHDVVIKDCQAVKHEDGYAVITWTFEYLSGPSAGQQFLDVSRLKSDAAKKYFKDVCDRLGVPFRDGDKVSTKCPKLVGKKAKLDVITRTSMYISDAISEPEEDYVNEPYDLGLDDDDIAMSALFE